MNPAFSISLIVSAGLLLWEAYNFLMAMSRFLAKQKLTEASLAFVGSGILTGLAIGLIYLASANWIPKSTKNAFMDKLFYTCIPKHKELYWINAAWQKSHGGRLNLFTQLNSFSNS